MVPHVVAVVALKAVVHGLTGNTTHWEEMVVKKGMDLMVGYFLDTSEAIRSEHDKSCRKLA